MTTQPNASAQDMLYAGTYSDRGSQGIYVLEFDRATGKLSERQTVEDKNSPSFLTIHPNGKYLYAVYREGKDADDQHGTVTAFAIDPKDGKLSKLNERSSEGAGPCHVSVDPAGQLVYVSNYGDGNLAVYPVGTDGKLGAATDVVQHSGSSVNPDRQQEPHMHSIIPSESGDIIYASDLGIDKIMLYQPDQSSGKLSPAAPPFAASTPGAGPRHFALHPEGQWAFSIEELSSTIAAYKVDKKSGNLTPVDRVTTLPKGASADGNSTADIHVSPDGKFVYASNRGHDSIVIYAIDTNTGKLTYVGNEPAGGKHPRNFCMDDQGEFVWVANRDTDNVVVFRRDAATGKLIPTGNEIKIPAVVCVQQFRLP
ncbi:MAG: lactonase family protein [Tunicatimonas sp.]